MEIVIHALQCGSVGTDETIPDRSKSTYEPEIKPHTITL